MSVRSLTENRYKYETDIYSQKETSEIFWAYKEDEELDNLTLTGHSEGKRIEESSEKPA